MSTIRRAARPCADCGQHTHNTSGRCDTHHKQWKKNEKQRSKFYDTTYWQRIRASIIDRDHHQCVTCGDHTTLQVHHIDHKLTNNSRQNLVTMCRSCHAKLEREHQQQKRGTYHDLLRNYIEISPNHY